MGVFSDIKPHELADLRATADGMLDTAAGERLRALLDAYEEMWDPDGVATLDQVEPLVKLVNARFNQVKKIHAMLDDDEKVRQEKAARKPPAKVPPARKRRAGGVVEDIDGKLGGLEEALDELRVVAEDLGPVREAKAEYYGALEDILGKQAELNTALEKLNAFAEVEDELLKLAENGNMEDARLLGHRLSPLLIVELAKVWKLARDFVEYVRNIAGAHV